MLKKLKRIGLMLCMGLFVFITSPLTASTLELKGKSFNVQIADTPSSQEKGLMFVRQLPEHQGMLFMFPYTANWTFWMKNTRIALDIIWFDESKKIVHIHHHAKPMDETPIDPKISAKYVLEINAGLAKKLHLKRGDRFKYL